MHHAVEKINNAGKEAISAFAQGDELKMMLMGLKRFTKIDPVNLRDMRRSVADAMVVEKKYIF
ncbi:MAG: hypothetical protein HC842_03790 [Cytophagales bacterium]|nr:hypothetical protein [Cytophagales bacterium]